MDHRSKSNTEYMYCNYLHFITPNITGSYTKDCHIEHVPEIEIVCKNGISVDLLTKFIEY